MIERAFDLGFVWHMRPADMKAMALSDLPLWEAQTERIAREMKE